MTEIRQIRRRISREMAHALREGRLDEYMRKRDREARAILRNGHRSRPRVKD